LVTVEIELPANHGFAPKCIHCQGSVLRISEAGQEPRRVALNINYMQFRNIGRGFADLRDIASEVGHWMA
jgi:hypothetical protein